MIEQEISGTPQTNIDLSVSVSGMELTVGAGTFSHQGAQYELTDDVVTDFGSEAFDRQIFGWLVEVVADGEITVLFDERGPGDAPYVFLPGGPYRLIERYVMATVPAGTTDLEDAGVELVVYPVRIPAKSDDRRGRRS